MIRDRGVARRYANALFGAALKSGELEPILSDLQSLEELHRRDQSLQDFLEAPDVLTEHKVDLLQRVLQGRVRDLVIRFLLLMLDKKRIQHLPLVLDHYRKLVEDHLGVVRAVVQTAIPLEQDLAGRLQQGLEKLTGKKVVLDPKLAPAIVGGIIVTLDGKIIDSSLRHQLATLREELLAAPVHS